MSEIRKIENFAAPELDVYARLSEPQLLHYYEPQPGLFLAESPRVIERALDVGYEPVSFLAGSAELAANEALFAHCPDAPVYTAETKVLEQLTGFALTRGMLCAMHRRTLPAMEEICRNARRVAILENVVNPTNVGAIFRSAAALGIDAVLLTSGCSNPLYRRAIRVSMGNVFQVPWTVLPGGSYWPEQGIAALQELGFYTVAMALKEDSVPMDDPSLKTHRCNRADSDDTRCGFTERRCGERCRILGAGGKKIKMFRRYRRLRNKNRIRDRFSGCIF